ncbi:GAF domain-containing sensor histidine kinase [Gelatiniphilus marinus]|uniref:histidine kinase n=1 Tax=Gelatiniphilus marinus TaxID=1759464 RepID=A0ABW5JWH8_9FLAO
MGKATIIERQMRFQELLIQISTTYINSDLSDIDHLINTSLKQIGQFVGADRSYIFSYNFNNNTTSNSYEWCANGIKPEIHNLQDVPLSHIPQWLDAHKKNEPFYVENVSLLPRDGEFGLRAILEPQGVKSLITIPKINNNELIGFIGFDSVKKLNTYTNNEKEILFVYANMLVNVIKRKENEEHIQEQERKKEELLLDLSEKNKQLNEYAHAVSHDLKAPLTNVHTLVSWFLDENKEQLSPKVLDNFKMVLSNVEKMDLLIKGILDYSTIDRLESQEIKVNLNQLVNEVIKTIFVPDHITINIQNTLPNLIGNNWRFRQVFQNLITNAINYNNKPKGVINIGCTNKDNHYKFYVQDNGAGIKAEYFERIFKAFNKLHNTGSNSGIGLSIVKKIISHYKGEIWVESEVGKGSTFYFTLLKK